MQKCYVFVNFYVQGRQVGIQAAHAVARLCRKDHPLIGSWMEQSEVLVVLNGGGSSEMELALDTIQTNDPDGVVAVFNEVGMNNLMTAFAYIPSDGVNNIAYMIKNGLYPESYDYADLSGAPAARIIATAHSHRG